MPKAPRKTIIKTKRESLSPPAALGGNVKREEKEDELHEFKAEENLLGRIPLTARVKDEEDEKKYNRGLSERLSDLPERKMLDSEINPFQDEVFSREHQWSKAFGGSPQGTISSVSPKMVKFDYTTFVYLHLGWNPLAPVFPGTHGLFFLSDRPAAEKKISALEQKEGGFPLALKLGPNQWRYTGHYKLHRAPPLTPSEYESLDEKTKITWRRTVNGPARKQWDDWAQRIIDTRHTRSPLYQGKKVDGPEFDLAVKEGVVVIQITILECVGYDIRIPQELMKYRSKGKVARSKVSDRRVKREASTDHSAEERDVDEMLVEGSVKSEEIQEVTTEPMATLRRSARNR